MSSPGPAERRSYALDQLDEKGHVSVNALSSALDVSDVTIRKDLQFLEDQNLVIRTHGGAISADQFAYDVPFEKKAQRQKEEKQRIGKKAAGMVKNQDTVILDSGTTTLQVLRGLKDRDIEGVTVSTNSVHIALETTGTPEIDVLLLGGTVRSKSASVVGPYAEQMLRDHSFSKLFLAGDGIDIGHGLTTTDDQEAYLNRLMIESADQTIVVADSSKFGRRGLCRICEIEPIDVLITDAVPDDIDRRLTENNVRVVIA
ncbi:DeoR/GlpR family DNA-binding transcription regulator [Salinibacter altiplanensis]|uniref:DeoR/GlpR family DNA-binding transcription regulator n=1 Tax=Salinibacter altiplanensis TaxID=1803181 RepID=UPI001319F1B7|nr:DeoR/GlpR family DNA-binding transcription regulator [Salinibacter altiplanensis]